MYKCKPERNAKQALLLVLCLSAFSCAGFLLATLVPESYRLITQLISILFLVMSVIIVIRYTVTELEYSVTEDTFAITEITGKRVTGTLSIPLESVVALVDKEEFLHSKDLCKVCAKLNKCQNIKAKSFVLVYELNGRRRMLEFEPNAAFVKLVNEAIENIKKNGGGDDINRKPKYPAQ